MGMLLLLACVPEPKPSTLEEIASRALPYTGTPEKAAVVRSINAFALDLYVTLAAESAENLFFSPFSISSALAMTYAGARGDTETQMEAALRFSLPQAALHPAFGALIGDITAAGARSGYELAAANSLWGQEDFIFLDAFLGILGNSYGAPLRKVDFVKYPEEARLAINAWAANGTRDRITDLMPRGSVDASTRLVLANAIYFKGAWARTFKGAETRDLPFQLPGSGTATVPMMHQDAEFNFMQDSQAQMVELPYTTGDLSMLFILPVSDAGIGGLEASLTADVLAQWCASLAPVTDLSVTIPRFTFTSTFRLGEELRTLGMTAAFDPGAADFSGISSAAGLSIGDVFHKSFVRVNEEGTEAAAATGVTIGVVSLPPSFFADRPFIFLIRHNRSGAILFLGRVMDPRQ